MDSENIPERAVDPSTKDLIFWIGKIAYWTVWPIYTAIYYVVSYLAVALLYIGKLIFRPLSFILAPLVYLARFLWACFLFPFHFLAKFETLYIYLSVAAFIGIVGGLVISLLYGSLQGALGLDQQQNPPGRTIKQYRKEKQEKKAGSDSAFLSPPHDISSGHVSLSDGLRKPRKGNSLSAQTIMEEVDSESSS
ncbi:hypothetical protein BDY17DRAFT_309912 [Neohortaea acidophila]|uniref:Uncharacterized protein n=1 Tax=Neohortaea acidophila TaxID=245834 RepID=A0A6A6PY97_9PEZI|nr:uncharacterized protein BDY17DRAFT_309912 [Neohortaea acidophila]KAF2484746.1 hypothetical protein BDY17DRAFT_309912 [Neohortaea acidophila]